MHRSQPLPASRRALARPLSLLALLAAAGPASAQLRWTELQPASSPAPRYGHAVALEIPRYEPFLFGGTDGTQSFGDTWSWNGSEWQVRATSGPAARHEHALRRLDYHDNQMLLFGGRDGAGQPLGDSWLWSAGQWQELALAGPSARWGHALATDEWVERTILLFGGRDAQGFSDETWIFVDNSWTELQPTTRPPARAGHVLFQDHESQSFLLHGGQDGTQVFDDEWAFDGTTWTQLASTGLPRSGHAIEYSGFLRDRELCFGGEGRSGTGQTLERTREGDWLPHTPVAAPAPRAESAVFRAFEGTAGYYSYLFGGRDAQGTALGDTWRLDFDTYASDEALDVGCGPAPWGHGTGPALFFTGRPWLGSTKKVSIMTPVAATTMLLAVGTEVLVLPFQPGLLGGSGSGLCDLRVLPVQMLDATIVSSSPGLTIGEVELEIPFDLALHGRRWVMQAIVPAPALASGRAHSAVLTLTLAE